MTLNQPRLIAPAYSWIRKALFKKLEAILIFDWVSVNGTETMASTRFPLNSLRTSSRCRSGSQKWRREERAHGLYLLFQVLQRSQLLTRKPSALSRNSFKYLSLINMTVNWFLLFCRLMLQCPILCACNCSRTKQSMCHFCSSKAFPDYSKAELRAGPKVLGREMWLLFGAHAITYHVHSIVSASKRKHADVDHSRHTKYLRRMDIKTHLRRHAQLRSVLHVGIYPVENSLFKKTYKRKQRSYLRVTQSKKKKKTHALK